MNPYNNNTLHAFQRIYQYANITLYTQKDIYKQFLTNYKNSIICFKTVVCSIEYILHFQGVLERQERVSLGGYFYLDLGTDIYRSYIYKQYELQYYRMNKQKYSLLLIDRKRTRKWFYLSDMIDLIQTNYSSVSFYIPLL